MARFARVLACTLMCAVAVIAELPGQSGNRMQAETSGADGRDGAGAAGNRSEIVLDLQTGFRGAYHAPGWVPFRLLVENLGETISGTITVETGVSEAFTTDEESFAREYPIDLATGSRKEFSFSMPVPEGFSPLHVQIESGSRPIHEQSIELPRPIIDGELVVVLSRQPSLDFLIGAEPDERAVPVYPLPEQLPERWVAYDGVRAIVIYDADLNRLSRGQVGAIGQWVRSGGTAVVVGGPGFNRQSAAALSGWLPFSYQGTGPLPETTILAASFQPTGTATSLFERNGVRAQRSSLGRGSVTTVNVAPTDLAELDVDRNTLWRRLLSVPESSISRITVPIGTAREPLEQPLLSGFIEQSHYRFPVQWIILAGVAIYGIVAWTLLRFARRFVLILPIAATIAVVVAYTTIAPPPFAAAQIEQYLGSSENDVGTRRSDVVLFGTVEKRYQVQLTRESNVVPLRGTRTVATAEGELAGRVEPWQISNHLGDSLATSPVRIERGRNDDSVTVLNRSSVALARGVVVVGDRAYPTGPVPPDQREEISIAVGRALEETPADSVRALNALQQSALARIRSLQGSQYPEGPLFVGWMEELLGPAGVEPDPVWVGRMSVVLISLPQEWFGEE